MAERCNNCFTSAPTFGLPPLVPTTVPAASMASMPLCKRALISLSRFSAERLVCSVVSWLVAVLPASTAAARGSAAAFSGVFHTSFTRSLSRASSSAMPPPS